MIKEIKAYRTSDGKLWEDASLASQIEENLEHSIRSEKIKKFVVDELSHSCYREYFVSVSKGGIPKNEPRAINVVQQLFIQDPYLMEKIIKEVIKLYE
jgi:hypothetical protein